MLPAEPRSQLEVAQRSYYVGFVAVLVLCFTPFKMLAYMLPGLFTAWMLAKAPSPETTRRLMVVLGAIAVGSLFYMVTASEFLLSNYLLAVVTYSAFLPILLIETRLLASRALMVRQLTAAATMVIVQGVVGTIQAFNGALQPNGSFGGANGDRVAGTIYPYLEPELAFSNPMFAVNMSLMLLACLWVPVLPGHKQRGYLVIGTISLVLASVLHALVMLVAAVGLAFVLTRLRAPRARRATATWKALVVTIGLVGGLSYVALPDNVEALTSVAETALDLDAVDIPRAVLLTRVITDLPRDAPLQPFVGLGPGQFSSRASLIASGLYLGGPDSPKPVPLLSPQSTPLAYEYCFSLMIAWFQADLVVGSTQQPFFSLLSIYTELGAVGVVAVLWFVFRLLGRVRRRIRAQPQLQFQALLFSASVLFLALLGLQENYWESPQAILVGLLLLKTMYANLMFDPVTPGASSGDATTAGDR